MILLGIEKFAKNRFGVAEVYTNPAVEDHPE
jgi:hypothetical protein